MLQKEKEDRNDSCACCVRNFTQISGYIHVDYGVHSRNPEIVYQSNEALCRSKLRHHSG